ncbi:unnamed protein product [Tilletia caries]|nr:unnamed protein product [Tilletia caries]
MPAHRKKKSVHNAAPAPRLILPRRPGYDSITKKYWCGCAVNGCSSSAQALSPVSKQGGNAFHSGSSDYNEDIMHFDFDSGDNGSNNNSQGGPSLDIDGINAADRETDDEDESDGSSEEDMDEFGDGVEPERVLDAQRPALPELATVRKQLGLVPHLVLYAVCPACERLSLVADASEECQACGEILYERAGKPVILFVYQTLTSWLSWLLQQPGIEAALQEWRDEPPSTTMRDVYDGAAWQSERDVNGAIMMTILNLPQRLRYMQASTYLSGCTPGPKKPSATRVGQYLQPLMEELAKFVDGKIIPTSTAPNGRKDYRFDEPLPSRDPRQHKRDSVRCSQPFTSKAAQTRHERRTGARASALNDLPYWNSVSRSPVDAMHCIELGLVKRLFHRTYIEGATITPQQLLVVQSLLRNSQIPASEEAPDHRLGDPGGGSATAAQWSTLGRRILVLAL